MLLDSYRGLPTDAKYLIYSAVLPFAAFGMFYTDLSFFLTSVQGISIPLMGLIVTVMGISTFAASIPLGVAADKYGRKRMFIAGNIISSIILAVFALTSNIAILLVAAVAEGISEAAFAASANALLADKAGDERRTSAYSLFGFIQSIAFGAGSLMIPLTMVFNSSGMTNQGAHVLLYVILAILSLFSTLFMLRIDEPRRVKRHGVNWKKMLPHKSKDPLSRYVISSGLIAFGAGLVVPLMAAWFGLRYGISDTVSGPLLGIASVVTGLAMLAGPSFAKRAGLVKAVTITQGLSTVFMFIIPLSPGYVLAGFSYTFRSVMMNIAAPLEQSVIMGIVIEDERGAASGINSAVWSLPNSLSSFIGPYLMALGFLAVPFFLSGIFYIVSIALFWFFFRDT